MHHTWTSLQLLLWASGINGLVQRIPRDQDLNGLSPQLEFVTADGHGPLKERDSADDPSPDLGFVTFSLGSKRVATGENHAETVSSVAQRLATKYGSKAPTRSLTSRDNNYNVETADTPTISNAVGISQDGTDYSYFIEANFGSEKKKMYMLLDTGASTTWVMGSTCVSAACTTHNKFGPDDSTTLKDTGEIYQVRYGSGQVSGHLVSDTVSIAGLALTMDFGLANVTSDQFSQFPFEGILGVSMVQGTWLTHLKDAKVIDHNVFGIALSRTADGKNDGEIAFGAPNKAKYTGDITYTPVKSQDSWAITMDDVAFDGNSAGVKGRLAYIDTGTTFVFGPPADVAALYKLIPGSRTIDNGKTYAIPCDTDASVSFTFSGKTWTASSRDFKTAPNTAGTCFGSVYGMEFVPGAWLVGDMFLKNVYSVFDLDQKQIGFAAKASSDNDGDSSSSSTATGTSTASPNGSSTGGVTAPTTTADGAGGDGLGLVPQETPAATAGGSTTGSAPGSTTTPDSSSVKSSAISTFASIICIVAIGILI